MHDIDHEDREIRYWTCDRCGKLFDQDNASRVHGKWICYDCLLETQKEDKAELED